MPAMTASSREELRGLQADLNFFAEKVGFELVKVDGVVGPKTLAAAQKVHDAVVAERPILGATIPKPDSVEAIVGLAPMYRVWLEGKARDALGVADLRRYHKGSGKDWNVKDTIAYGAGPVHQDFVALQHDLNRYAGSLGFATLTTDGFLGAKTAAAVKQVYDAVVARNPLLVVTLFPVPDTKEEVAEYAQFIRSWLAKTAAKHLLAEQA
jgi:lysozyme family protein